MHTFTEDPTFHSLKKGRYRCNQTGQVITQKEISSYLSRYLANDGIVVVRRGAKSKVRTFTQGSSRLSAV